MTSGEMSDAEFTAFLSSVFEQLAAYSVDGAIHFQCIDWRHIGEMLEAGKGTYTELKNICVWSKANAGMGSFYRSQHEFVCVFKSGERTAHQQYRARQIRPLPHEYLDLCGRQRLRR